jgi:hypothetical protein
MVVFWDIAPFILIEITDVSDVLIASDIRMMNALIMVVNTSETSVNFYQTTRRNIPEESRLYVGYVKVLSW